MKTLFLSVVLACSLLVVYTYPVDDEERDYQMLRRILKEVGELHEKAAKRGKPCFADNPMTLYECYGFHKRDASSDLLNELGQDGN